jgi:hypothetical protein
MSDFVLSVVLLSGNLHLLGQMQAFVSRDIRQIATLAWQLGSLFRGNKHNIGGWLICGEWIDCRC